MLDGMQQRMAERVMGSVTPSETAVGQAAVAELVSAELRMAEAVDSLLDACDDVDETIAYSAEARQKRLLSLADAVAEQDVENWWWDHVAPEVLDSPEQARQYVGVGGSEWHDQIREWHNQYHDAGVVEEPVGAADPADIGETAAKHVRTQFGISLREFLAGVVNWDRSQMRVALRGPVDDQARMIEQVATELDDE